jgi:hypothetical protein
MRAAITGWDMPKRPADVQNVGNVTRNAISPLLAGTT